MEFTGRGRFFGIVSRISDLIVLGCIFILTSLPIFTLGASCTALYYSVAKSIRFEEGKPVREYFKAWKNNFVQSSIATIIYLLLTGALVCTAVICSDGSMDYFYYIRRSNTGKFFYLLFSGPFTIYCFIKGVFSNIYIFCSTLHCKNGNAAYYAGVVHIGIFHSTCGIACINSVFYILCNFFCRAAF